MKKHSKNHEKTHPKNETFSEDLKNHVVLHFWKVLASVYHFWYDFEPICDFPGAPKMSLGASKTHPRSSSLSWTVQISRNRSRPGADRVRFGIDLAPRTYFSRFWDGCLSILGPFLGWFWKNFQWILELILRGNSRIFHICLERFH